MSVRVARKLSFHGADMGGAMRDARRVGCGRRERRARRALGLVVATLGVLLVPLTGAPAGAAAGMPTVTGPVTGGTHGFPHMASSLPLAALGYTEEEFFFEGTAQAYTSAAALTSDGAWTVTPASTAAFRSRMLVRRPTPERFNGTVVVEWFNVTGGLDVGAFWAQSSDELIRSGYAYVAVSAQFVGLESYPLDNPRTTAAPKRWDPARYGSLVHPGDSYSYDIFSQAGQALRTPGAVDPLGGLHPTRVLALGESQSAGRLVTYVNAVHPLVHVYDGYVIYSRFGTGAALSEAPLPQINAPTPTMIRTDLDVPVLVLEAETDALGHFPARQPDTNRYRLWELTGSAHFDQAGLSATAQDAALLGISQQSQASRSACGYEINKLPSHYVVAASVARLDRWVRDGTPPPTAPPITIAPGTGIVRDETGHALGGIRSPWVDAPLGVLSGQSGGGPVFCFLFGSFTPFDGGALAQRYPTQAAYGAAFSSTAAAMERDGFLLTADLAEVQRRANDSVYAFGTATLAGSTGGVALNQRVVGMAVAPAGGYWEVAADGGVFAHGGAPFLGSAGALPLYQPIVGMAADPDGEGYWLVAADGGVFAYRAPFLGSTGALRLNQPIVGMAATATGDGYWLVAADGGVFAFGDAVFAGSTGSLALVSPIVGMAADTDGSGYWLGAADGGVFAFDAPFRGSAVGGIATVNERDAVVGIADVPGSGYRLATRSGRVLSFGPAVIVGDAASNTRDVVGIASVPDGRGYYLAVAPAV
jgi:hypothetical protein